MAGPVLACQHWGFMVGPPYAQALGPYSALALQPHAKLGDVYWLWSHVLGPGLYSGSLC